MNNLGWHFFVAKLAGKQTNITRNSKPTRVHPINHYVDYVFVFSRAPFLNPQKSPITSFGPVPQRQQLLELWMAMVSQQQGQVSDAQ